MGKSRGQQRFLTMMVAWCTAVSPVVVSAPPVYAQSVEASVQNMHSGQIFYLDGQNVTIISGAELIAGDKSSAGSLKLIPKRGVEGTVKAEARNASGAVTKRFTVNITPGPEDKPAFKEIDLVYGAVHSTGIDKNLETPFKVTVGEGAVKVTRRDNVIFISALKNQPGVAVVEIYDERGLREQIDFNLLEKEPPRPQVWEMSTLATFTTTLRGGERVEFVSGKEYFQTPQVTPTEWSVKAMPDAIGKRGMVAVYNEKGDIDRRIELLVVPPRDANYYEEEVIAREGMTTTIKGLTPNSSFRSGSKTIDAITWSTKDHNLVVTPKAGNVDTVISFEERDETRKHIRTVHIRVGAARNTFEAPRDVTATPKVNADPAPSETQDAKTGATFNPAIIAAIVVPLLLIAGAGAFAAMQLGAFGL